MMRGKKRGTTSGCDKIVLNKTYIHTYADEMDSGHTRSISVLTRSQYVLDHHSMWIKNYTALSSRKPKGNIETTIGCVEERRNNTSDSS